MTTIPAPPFHLHRPDSASVALGLAVTYLMAKPAFARLRFGDWSRILIGQINRGHYRFVADSDRRIQGFAGWALATRANAEDWVEGRRSLSFEDSKAGECVVFNAWAADSGLVHRFMVDGARALFQDKRTLYFKRYYTDGRVRPARLNVNGFVALHIARGLAAATEIVADGNRR